MNTEKLWFNKNNLEKGKQLDIKFTDLEKDKDGKTIYDFLKEARIKESDDDYKKILNSITFKNEYFYVGNQLAKTYFHWRKVYGKNDKSNQSNNAIDTVSLNFKSPGKVLKQKKENKPEEPLSKKEEKRRDFLYGQWD